MSMEQTGISDIHIQIHSFSSVQERPMYHIHNAPKHPPSQLALSKNRTNFLILTTISCQLTMEIEDVSASKSICLLFWPGICFRGDSWCRKEAFIYTYIYIKCIYLYKCIHTKIYIYAHTYIYMPTENALCAHVYIWKGRNQGNWWDASVPVQFYNLVL